MSAMAGGFSAPMRGRRRRVGFVMRHGLSLLGSAWDRPHCRKGEQNAQDLSAPGRLFQKIQQIQRPGETRANPGKIEELHISMNLAGYRAKTKWPGEFHPAMTICSQPPARSTI
jgi:hypothetical protein